MNQMNTKVPVDTFPSAAAQTVVSLFALPGLSQFMICLLCTLVLVRYRSMVPVATPPRPSSGAGVVIMVAIGKASPRLKSRIAGVFYLLEMLMGGLLSSLLAAGFLYLATPRRHRRTSWRTSLYCG
jgi:hypothetical protein